MIQFKQIKTTSIDEIEVESGMLLKSFNPAEPSTPTDSDILGITSGGFSLTINADYEDFGADIDNLPNGTKEFKRRTAWHVSLTTNLIDQSILNIKFALGCTASTDVTASHVNDGDGNGVALDKMTFQKDLKSGDFGDLYAAYNLLNGDWIVVNIKNALSTGGYQLTTSKNGKGQTAITIEGHPTVNDEHAPVEIYYGRSVSPVEDVSAETGTGGTGTGGTGTGG